MKNMDASRGWTELMGSLHLFLLLIFIMSWWYRRNQAANNTKSSLLAYNLQKPTHKHCNVFCVLKTRAYDGRTNCGEPKKFE